MQVCPAFINFPQTIRFAANFKLAVSSIIQGFFPPNSNVIGVRYSAAALATIFPTATLPVKKI